MPFYITGYNGIDLPTITASRMPGVSGVHDLPQLAVSTEKVPGGLRPNLTVLEDDFQTITFRAVVAGDCATIMPLLGTEALGDLAWQWSTWVIYPNDSHAGLARNLDLLRQILRPDGDFHALVVADRPGQEIMAFFPSRIQVAVDELPADTTAVQISIPALCYPYWQDSTQRTKTVTAATDYVHNGGRKVCYPIYTCTITDTLASGLSFMVGADEFVYGGALYAADVLVINADPHEQTVTLNGAADMANVDVDSVFPGFALGRNVITRADPGKWTLGLAWRQRY